MRISDIRQRISTSRALRHCEAQEVAGDSYYPEHHKITDVHYFCAGDPDSPTTVVFIHGFTLAASSWHFQVEHIRSQARCIVVDYRGHGQSVLDAGRKDADIAELNIAGAADDIVAALEQEDIQGPIIFAGHSLGGMVLCNLLRRYPWWREQCAEILLIATAVDSFASKGVAKILGLPVVERVRTFAEVSPEQAQQLRSVVTEFTAPTLKATVFQSPTPVEVIRFHADLIKNTAITTMVGFLDDLQDHEERAALADIQDIPGIILVGADDAVTPVSQANAIKEGWPQAAIQVIPGAGHMLPIEQPWVVNNALDTMVSAIAARESKTNE
ncbi:MAG: alpha/beta hydrolase [Corynebacterium sp.]|nr:alpha/beta hydrolase [Corynebacterium sp.]